jgi:hypothetical protein
MNIFSDLLKKGPVNGLEVGTCRSVFVAVLCSPDDSLLDGPFCRCCSFAWWRKRVGELSGSGKCMPSTVAFVG